MATAPFVHLGGAKLEGTVLENLKSAGAAQSFISDTLNTALKAKLVNAATQAGQSELTTLLQAIPAVDIAADASLNLHDFVTRVVTLPTDPKAKAAVEAAIAKLSTTTTVSDLLGLNSNLKGNPLFTAEVQKVNLATLLGTSPVLASAQLQDDFINTYASFKGPIADFWSQLSQNEEFKAVVLEIQFTLQLGLLSLNNPPLVTALRTNFQPKTPRDLTTLSASDWTSLLTSQNIPVPDAIPGSTATEKISNYANGILAVLESAFPTDYIAQGITQLAVTKNDPTTQGVSQFLKNSPDFNFLTTNVDAYISKSGTTAFQYIPAAGQKAVTNDLKIYQRMVRVSTDFGVITTLRDAGFNSAYSIAMMPRSAFIQKFSGQFGGATQAGAIYDGAQHITASALSLWANVRTVLNGASPIVLGDVGNSVEAVLNASGIPNWQTLFGSLSYCSCEDCRSVLSAAAYFVDLLQFLKNSSPNSQGYTPLDILIGSGGGIASELRPPGPPPTPGGPILGRRPDLAYIKLNCENTNTPLPYVDLVNEILESFMALNGKLDRTTAKNTPTDATAEELSASPEYTNDAAYTTLETAVYLQTLPFDRWLETARSYLQFLNSSLYEMMNSFQVGGDPSDVTKGTPSGLALACEYLKISAAEYTILTGKDFQGMPQPSHNPWDFYGYKPRHLPTDLPGTVYCPSSNVFTNWKLCLRQVPEFLQRTSIAYTDLVTLLETQFINPTQSITLQACSGIDPSVPCDLTHIWIVDASASNQILQDATLDRMHQFIRLWKKLGWTMVDLDRAIIALGATDINQALIVSLAQVQQLASSLNLSSNQLLSFWTNIDTDGTGSLYVQLFQNRAVLNPVDLAFQLDYAAPLKTLPSNLVLSPVHGILPRLDRVLPGPLSAQVTYDGAARELKFASNDMTDDQRAVLGSPMTSDQKSLLLSLSNDGSYQTAVNALFDAQTASATASLAALPGGLSLPAHLPGTVYYDGANLHFIGLMTDDQRDVLVGLSSDASYQLAVDNLSNARSFPGSAAATLAQKNASIGDHLSTILAALQITADDLTAIATATALYNANSSAWANLSLENLSVLHRHALLASVLGVLVKDLLSLIALTGATLFQAGSPAPTLAFVQRVQKFQASPFSVAQLNYLYRDLYDPNGGIAPLAADISLLFTTLQQGLAKIASDNTPVSDPKGDLLRKKLGTLLGSKLADAGMGLINGTAVYSTPLAAVSTITLLNFVTYDAASGQLSMANHSAMTAPQLSQLLAISPDTDYQTAVNNLYAASNHVPTYSAPLASLPAITLPNFVAYDSTAKQLKITANTAMTAAQQTQLVGLSSDANYHTAVESLYAASQPASYSVPLDRLPDVLSLFLDIPINYDSANQQVVLSGTIYPDQTAQLAKLSTDTNYETAIATVVSNSSQPNATPPYIYALPSLPPGVVMPGQLKGSIAYDPTGQQLRLTGPMTDAERATLLTLSNDPNYQAAINNLYQQPRDFISQNFAGFLNPTDATTQLIENPQDLDRAKETAQNIDYVMQGLMPYLRETLSQSFIKQTLSDHLQLDPKLTDLLLSAVLNSQTALGQITLPAFVTYASQRLSMATPMTVSQQSQLLAVSPEPDYQQAINSLYAAGQSGGSSPFTVSLASLPAEAQAMADFLALAGDGLSASYIPNQNIGTGLPPQKRIDPTVNFNWGFGLPDSLIPSRPFSVKWSGYVMPQFTEDYTFYVRAGGAVTLSVNGQQLINQTKDLPPAELRNSLAISLTAGQLYAIELDWQVDTASASVQLSWSSPSTLKAVIPQTQLFSGTLFTSLMPAVNSYLLIFKAALLANTLRMTADDVTYLSAHPGDFDNFDLNNLPLNRSANPAATDQNAVVLFAQWERLNALLSLRNSLPGGDAGLLHIFALASASTTSPTAPVLSQVAGGTFPDSTYFVRITYSTAEGETLPSAETSLAVAPGNLLQVASPTPARGATGWNVYLSTSMGSETKQNASPLPLGTPWTEPATGLIAGTAIPTTANAVLQASGWDSGEFATLTSRFGFTDPDFRNEIVLAKLNTCMSLIGRLGVSSKQLFTWASFGTNSALESSIAQDIKNTVKAKYDDTTWVTVGKPLNDKLREASKEALIVYILTMGVTASDGSLITTSDQLYEYFLIDVEMSPCMMTSRIVQATAAIQLFVQRCLMNLENGNPTNSALNISPDAINADQWEWRKNYRVWQANREVFLYPENWIVPELRDDKTPFFQDLEADLLQNDVTADNVEQAYLNYLNKLDEVARLEICGTYWQNETDPNGSGTINIFHVFGRTFATPHVYYYRQLDFNTGVWSAWETVDTDIQANHLVPVVWNRRLFIFWPIFKETADPTSITQGVPIPNAGDPNYSPPPPTKVLEINLCWSEYKQGKWSKKHTSANVLTPWNYDYYPIPLYTWSFFFGATTNNGELTITSYQGASGWDQSTLIGGYPGSYSPSPSNWVSGEGGFTFAGCNSNPIASSPAPGGTALPNIQSLVVPENTYMYDNSLREWDTGQQNTGYANRLVLVASDWLLLFPLDVPTLNVAPSQYVLTFPQQFFPMFKLQGTDPGIPFFYEDTQRSYFVTNGLPDPWTQLLSGANVTAVYSSNQLSMQPRFSDLGNVIVFEPTSRVLTPTRTIPSVTGTAVVSTSTAALSSPARVPASTAVLPTLSSTSALPPWTQLLSGSPQVTFSIHDHPHVCAFIKTLNWKGVPALLSLATQSLTNDLLWNLFSTTYSPTAAVTTPYPKEDVDFSYGGAYSIYNWELFFHIPLLIATRLSQNQQFEDAQKWFHYIFNPTSNSTDPVPQRYWNCLPFYQNTESQRIQDLLTLLDYTGNDPTTLAKKTQMENEIAQWENDPFNPFLIARMRLIAFQKTTVMKYLDNLIAWGDNLFSQNTRESINEATQIYVLADQILGSRPTQIQERGTIQDYTYHDLTTQFSLDDFSNALVQMENQFPFTTAASGSGSNSGVSSATSTSTTSFYFCVPPDDQLLGYWDTVADRLYKIRHCMNIQGQVEQLPLFAPPISPALLVQAAAMGVDLSSVLSDINAPAPNYRFTTMVQKALEICSEVRSFGGGILSALEKKDAEHLAYLRATQETSLLQAIKTMKQRQLDEANANLVALNISLAVVQNRQTYYQGLIAAGLSSYEQNHLQQLSQAQNYQQLSQTAELIGSELSLYPEIDIGVTGAGGTPKVTAAFGGRELSAVAGFVARGFSMMASFYSYLANLSSTLGNWDRRSQDWNFQAQSAGLEIAQINQQIAAANIRIQIAQTDLDNQDLQIQNAQNVQDFLQSKFTNEDLYSWMVDKISTVYFQCYQLAYETAKKAERALQFERGLTDSSYIRFGYWDSLKKGLLAGEHLYMDLKRMEMAYLDMNVRDYEIIKYVSLVLLDPLALIALKETGHCIVTMPESLFDTDYPGHYVRRLKSVSLTIPCVTGPYTSVNCTLTLLTSKIRIDNVAGSSQDYASDAHFITNFAATQAIATSTAQNDSGMFELNFRDERYLPFEGAGVISTWQIDLPPDTNAFDFETISDVVINLKYQARDGGATLAGVARQVAVMPAFALQAGPATSPVPFPPQTNLARLFSLKHEFPSEWYKFLNPPDTTISQSMQIALTMERFPYQYRGRKIAISRVELFLKFKDPFDLTTYNALKVSITPPKGQAQSGTLAAISTFLNGLPFAALTLASGTAPGLGNWTLAANKADIRQLPAPIDDIVMVCHYSAK